MELDPETVCFLIVKAREFDAKVPPLEPDPGSNPSDERVREILEDYDDDSVVQEINALIDALNVDEQCELVALTWLGRGDDEVGNWNELVRLSGERHNEQTAAYLLGIPRLGDYLEEGLACLGYDCGEIERAHL